MRRTLPTIVALGLCWVPVTLAATSSPSSSGSRPGTDSVAIVTIPRLAGVRFVVGDRVIETGRDGTASVHLPGPGEYPLRILDQTVRHGSVRSRFSRWGDNSFTSTRTVDVHGPTRLEVGFQQSVLVGFRFLDLGDGAVDPDRVSKLSIASTIGTHESFRPDRPRWLIAGRVTRRFRGLEQTQIQYAIEKAFVDGSNVVNRAQQRFYPLRRRTVGVHLLLYSARLSAHDFLFGFPIGRRVELVYPNGNRVVREFEGGKLFLRDLPRGTYGLRVQAGGYSPLVSLALSKNQVLELKVVSYLDLLVIALLGMAALSLLVLLPRPALRRKLHDAGRDGLAASRRTLARASSRLRPGSRTAAEPPVRASHPKHGARRGAAKGSEPGAPDTDGSDHRAYIDTLISRGIGPAQGLVLYQQAGGTIRSKEWFRAYHAAEEDLRLRRQSVARSPSTRRERFPGGRTLSSEWRRSSVAATPWRELNKRP
jgi:hypothetical protein